MGCCPHDVCALYAAAHDQHAPFASHSTRHVRFCRPCRFVFSSFHFRYLPTANTQKGYTAAGLISLATQAPSVVPSDKWTTLTLPDGDLLKGLGIISGLFIILFSFWFFCISTIAVIAGIRRMSFTLNWWAFIFPNAGLTLAAIQAGKALNSPGINGICSALTIGLVIMWFVTSFMCVRAVWRGDLLWPGKDEDKTMQGIRWGRHGAFPDREGELNGRA